MGVFANNAITDAGRILEGELKMGSVFTPTRIVMGSGFLPSGTTARTIKDVISPVISLQINKKNMSNNGTVVIGGVYSNAEIQSDFYFRELALYAKAVKSDGSATDEILYSYGNAGNAADLMPAYTSGTAVERQIDIATYVGIDIKVDLTIESGVYVTQKQLEDALNSDENVQQILNTHIANKQNPHNTTAAHVGAIPTAQKGAANGVATLDSNKQLTSTQIPLSITNHIASRQNPHGVTAAQVGAYTKAETNNLINAGKVPTGSVFWFATNNAPSGFLICDGSKISRTTYSALFNIIGTAFGAGDGSTTFTLPNLINNFIKGSKSVGSKSNGTTLATKDMYTTGITRTFVSNYMSKTTSNYNGTIASGEAVSHECSEYTIQPPNLTLLPCIKY